MILSLLLTLLGSHAGHCLRLAILRASRTVRRIIVPKAIRWASPGNLPDDIALYCAAYASGCRMAVVAVARTYWPVGFV